LAKAQRTIKVGVGNWYHQADVVKEAFRDDAMTLVGEVGVGLKGVGETFEIAGLDEFGRRIDDKTGEVIPWPESKPFEDLDVMDDYYSKMKLAVEDETGDGEEVDIVQAWKNENAKRREKKIRRQELARSYKFEIAEHLAQRHRSVISP